jgi:hypothetical protein
MPNPFSTSELLKSASAYPVNKGDVEGHRFHGNQWVVGGGRDDLPRKPTVGQSASLRSSRGVNYHHVITSVKPESNQVGARMVRHTGTLPGHIEEQLRNASSMEERAKIVADPKNEGDLAPETKFTQLSGGSIVPNEDTDWWNSALKLNSDAK